MQKDIICWWSGGVTSAVACKIAINIYGVDRCRVILFDAKNEHEDTYRFRTDCSFWYGVEIESLSGLGGDSKYQTIQDIWYDYESLNVATGEICSTELKRYIRKKFEKENEYTYQVFGYEFDKKEMNRALSMAAFNADAKPIFPLLMYGYDKGKCIEILQNAGIRIPETYHLGFHNNNCFQTGCVQGGMGYWQKMREDFPDKFNAMAKVEHDLTDLRGEPVTMLKDQSNEAKENKKKVKKSDLVFLLKHPDYPNHKQLSDFKRVEVKPLMECNGFCGTNVANGRNETIKELNFDENG